jgi:hypothetical protein
MSHPGLQQEAEEAAARIGILRHDGRYPDFFAGYEAAAGMPSFEHMEAVAKLSALRGAARAVLNESAEATMDDPEREWTAAFRALADLLEGAEADPDVAETAWAIIDHHRLHRTAG